MRHTEAQLWDRLETALDMDPGEAQVEQVRDLVREAEAGGYQDLLIEARLAFVDVRVKWSTGPEDVSDLLTGYIRCVSMYTAMPERFTERHVDNLWRGLGMVGIVMLEIADRPVEQIRRVLDDMEPCCRTDRDGDLHMVYLVRMKLEARVGNFAAADEAAYRLRTLKPAEYINPGGVVLEHVEYLVEAGRDVEAISAMEPLLSGQVLFDGDTDPHECLDWLLLPYLRTGQLTAARDAHRRGWRKDLTGFRLAAHLEFCARTGNTERGREVLHRNLNAFVGAPDMVSEMTAAAAAALLCRRLMELGERDETWIWPPNPDIPGDEPEEYTYTKLYGELVDDATGFAAKLDASNGNTYQSERIRALMAAQPIVASLPLSPVDEARSRHSVPTVRSTATAQGSVPERPMTPEDRAALLDAAERAQHITDRDGVIQALERYNAAGAPPDELSAARVAELRAVVATEPAQRELLARQAADGYRRLGQTVREQVCLGRLGLALCRDGKVTEGTRLVADALSALRITGDPYLIAGAQIWRGGAHELAGDLEAAAASFAEAEATLEAANDDPARTNALLGTSRFYRAQILTGESREPRHVEAATLAGSAAAAYRAAGSRGALIDARMLQASAARSAGDAATALEAYGEIIEVGAGTERAAVAHAARGELLLHAVGNPESAIDDLVEAVAALTALGDPRAVYAQVDLATAYRTLDRWLDTAEAAEAAIPILDAWNADHRDAMQVRWMLVQAYEGLGQPVDALRVLGEMRERHDGEPGQVGLLSKKAAILLSDLESNEQAAAEYLVAAEAYAKSGQLSEEIDCRRQAAMELHWSGSGDRAIPLMGEVQDLVRRLSTDTREATHERALTSYAAAQILVGAERYDEALLHALTAIDGYRAVDERGMAGVCGLMAARIHDLEDRQEQALEVLRQALTDLPEGSDEHIEATDLLAEITGG